jgi:hypothetical protein
LINPQPQAGGAFNNVKRKTNDLDVLSAIVPAKANANVSVAPTDRLQGRVKALAPLRAARPISQF